MITGARTRRRLSATWRDADKGSTFTTTRGKRIAKSESGATRKALRHQRCSICRNIPDRAEASWKGGELLGDRLPAAEGKLTVVGAPFFNDRDNHSHSCLKQCPKCGTYYDWSFTYEYLVNGSEDDVVLTRLHDKQGEKRAKAIFETIGTAGEKFRAEAAARVKTLLRSSNGKGVYGAATFLQSGQSRGHDISFAVRALAEALVRFSGADESDSYLESCASLVYFVLRDAVKGSREASGEVIDILRDKGVDLTTETKQLKWIVADCRQAQRT